MMPGIESLRDDPHVGDDLFPERQPTNPGLYAQSKRKCFQAIHMDRIWNPDLEAADFRAQKSTILYGIRS